MVEFTKEEKEYIIDRWFQASERHDNRYMSLQDKDKILYEKLKAWVED